MAMSKLQLILYERKQGATMKIGFVSMPLSGHLNPMTALARRLQSRGNEVVFLGVPDVEPLACGHVCNSNDA